jgi:hypothetical protein
MDMHTLTRNLLSLIAAASFGFGSASALAMPKAAEHEDAPVTSGVNATRPKHSSTAAKPPVVAKAKPASKAKPAGKAGKPAKAGKPGKPTKAAIAGKSANTGKAGTAARPSGKISHSKK